MNAKKELYLLFLSFVLPIGLGTLFFFLNPNYFAQDTVNFGTLIQPVITTEETDITLDTTEQISGIWTMAYLTAADGCNTQCVETLDTLATTRLLLNEDMRRLRIITLGSNALTKVPSAIISSSLEQKLTPYSSGTIFVIDPIGNILMYYDSKTFDVKKVLKDFKRLLKYSRIG